MSSPYSSQTVVNEIVAPTFTLFPKIAYRIAPNNLEHAHRFGRQALTYDRARNRFYINPKNDQLFFDGEDVLENYLARYRCYERGQKIQHVIVLPRAAWGSYSLRILGSLRLMECLKTVTLTYSALLGVVSDVDFNEKEQVLRLDDCQVDSPEVIFQDTNDLIDLRASILSRGLATLLVMKIRPNPTKGAIQDVSDRVSSTTLSDSISSTDSTSPSPPVPLQIPIQQSALKASTPPSPSPSYLSSCVLQSGSSPASYAPSELSTRSFYIENVRFSRPFQSTFHANKEAREAVKDMYELVTQANERKMYVSWELDIFTAFSLGDSPPGIEAIASRRIDFLMTWTPQVVARRSRIWWSLEPTVLRFP
ncbi:uncharacterized protein PAC_18410 [Phialocephala subalpina]|uniref:Uncharacterized protein n=1 Tax=Phialocephala subalpina TaxID=576137 RepID=A0A1L7XU00_9HELO|nr:uncharacterized protein PAC_18410 [Phialocephala subalpina]